MRIILLLVLVCLTIDVQAQRISNTAIYRDIPSKKYLRFYYDNDFFGGTDRYYSQGINFEIVHPAIGNFFLTKLLIQSPCKQTKFGIALEHEGFTPTRIKQAEILSDDRPYAGSMFFKFFSIVNDPIQNSRVTSALSLGVLGPMAGSKELQRGIHEVVRFDEPNGWKNQIQNDILVNYEFEYERKLVSSRDYFLLTAKAGLRGGTYSTRALIGFTTMIGSFDDPFKNFQLRNNRHLVYLYLEPLLYGVVYDATLQGGVFNKQNPYVIVDYDIRRMVFQGTAGVVYKTRNHYFELFQSYLTDEFKSGHNHGWGGFRVGWYLRSK